MHKKKKDGLAHGEQSLPAMTHWAGASVGRHALPALANVYRTQSLVLGGGRVRCRRGMRHKEGVSGQTWQRV